MSLLSEAQALSATQTGPACRVASLLANLSPADQAELREALAAPVYSRALAQALQARGHEIGSSTVGRHRRGECKCPS